MSPPLPGGWKLLALDFDRTVTDHPHGVHPDVPAALRRAREAGLVVAICSGQPVDRLRRALPDLDAYAGENGSVLWARGDPASRKAPWPERAALLEALGAAHIPFGSFEVILDVPRKHEAALAKLLDGSFAARAVPNVDAINVQPADVSKGTALAWLRQRWGIPREACIAVGDGENDVPFLREAGLGVAVANAVPSLQAVAGLLLDQPGGAGVRDLVDMVIGGRLPQPMPGGSRED